MAQIVGEHLTKAKEHKAEKLVAGEARTEKVGEEQVGEMLVSG